MLVLGVWGLYRGHPRLQVLRAKVISVHWQLAVYSSRCKRIVGRHLVVKQSGSPERFELHVCCTALCCRFSAVLFAYIKGDDTNRGQWVYAFGTLFLFWMMLRLVDISG